MRSKTKQKSISERLTPIQVDAIRLSAEGNSIPLIRCIYASVKAIDKIMAMGVMGAGKWATSSAAHHIEVRDYLFAQLPEGEIRQQIYNDIFAP